LIFDQRLTATCEVDWSELCPYWWFEQKQMLKITILDTPIGDGWCGGQAGRTWTAELRKGVPGAAADLRGRELEIELRNVTCISEDGQNVLLS